MRLLDAYDAIVARGAAPAHAEAVRAMRAGYEARTGAFGPEDAWFEARSRAFWDDAVTTQRFADVVAAGDAGDALAEAAARLTRAHRGLFVVEGRHGAAYHVRDLWGGGDFWVHDVEPGLGDALAAAGAPFDARLVGSALPSPRVAMLPGALFHPEGALDAIAAVLKHARDAELATGDVLDALLRMELGFRALTRMKPAYAYRPEALAKRRGLRTADG